MALLIGKDMMDGVLLNDSTTAANREISESQTPPRYGFTASIVAETK